MLLAVVASDGPPDGQAITGVSGAGLTWRRIVHGSGAAGAVEVWSAVAGQPIANATVRAAQAVGGYHGMVSVLALSGADIHLPIGAWAQAGAGGGTPALDLRVPVAGSLVVGGGNDYERAADRSPLAGQELTSQFLDTATGDTYWAQRTTGPTTERR